MAVIESLVVAGGLTVAFGFPILGILVYWYVSSVFTDDTERPQSIPPAHGYD